MNLLHAINNIINLSEISLISDNSGNNRINIIGAGLERFIKNAFSDTLVGVTDDERRKRNHEMFSYEGSTVRPPDLMLKGGDAIEVKKIENVFHPLQLNSSYPKAKLFSSSMLINNTCRQCEEWTEKDIIYTIGHLPPRSTSISSLWFVYGSIYAANEEEYLNVKDNIAQGIQSIPDVDFSPTRELGRVNGVDPLRITNMRIRGMWIIQAPSRVYDYLYSYDTDVAFQLVAIIPLQKWNSFPKEDRVMLENHALVNRGLTIDDVGVKNPNNPVNLIDAKLIVFKK